MPRVPSDHRHRLKRIQALCAEVTNNIETSRHHREAAFKLAKEALDLAESVGCEDKALEGEDSKRR